MKVLIFPIILQLNINYMYIYLPGNWVFPSIYKKKKKNQINDNTLKTKIMLSLKIFSTG